MLDQAANLLNVQILVYIIPVIMVLLTIFTIAILYRYIKTKKKTPFYLGLGFLLYDISVIFILFGQLDLLNNAGIYSPLGSWLFAISLTSIQLGGVLFYNFYAEIKEMSKLKQVVVSALGIAIGVWILLPVDDQLGIVPITFTLMGVYSGYVYLTIAITILKAMRRMKETNKGFLFIGLGGIFMTVFFVLISLSNITGNVIINIGANVTLVIAMACFYLGFIQPSLKTVKNGN